MINKKIIEFKNESFYKNDFKTITEKNIIGKWTIFFFYPADFTFVCPTELEDLNDFYDEFKKNDIEVMSISTDTHFAHKAWHDSSDSIKKIKFPMVGDPTGKLSRSFGVYDEDTGLSQRATFLIDPEGKIKIVEIHDDGIGRNASELLRKVLAAKFVKEHPGEVCPAKWNVGSKTLKPGLDLVGKI